MEAYDIGYREGQRGTWLTIERVGTLLMEAGYCLNACLDWAERELQAGYDDGMRKHPIMGRLDWQERNGYVDNR